MLFSCLTFKSWTMRAFQLLCFKLKLMFKKQNAKKLFFKFLTKNKVAKNVIFLYIFYLNAKF